jgi:DNA-binding transcriptional MerR regulator
MNAKKGVKGSELCRTLDLQPYVLRYWETEFKALQAAASGGGQRTYSEADVALVRRIKQLLYEEGYTIAGAKKKLEAEPLEVGARAESAPLFDVPVLEAPESPERAAARAPAAVRTGSRRTVAPSPEVAALDTVSPERIEQLRRGIEEALADAKSVLGILDKHPR